MYCRLCAGIKLDRDNESFPTITHPQDIEFINKVKLCVNVDLTEHDSLPKQVCNECTKKVTQFYEFLQQVFIAQKLLVDITGTNAPKLEKVSLEELNNEELITNVKIEDEPTALVEEVVKEESIINRNRLSPRTRLTKRTKIKKLSPLTRRFKITRNESIKSENVKVEDNGVSCVIKEERDLRNIFSDSSRQYIKYKKWECVECGQTLDRVQLLRNHYSTEHPHVSVKYKCYLCPKIYGRYRTCLNHTYMHRDRNKYTCPGCPKVFHTQKDFKQHVLIHSDERKFKCDVCGRMFKRKQNLTLHQANLHGDGNVYKCEKCHKEFNCASSLNLHQRIHAEVPQHTCEQCGRGFTQKGNLTAHIATVHNDQAPFKCQLCPKSFKLLSGHKRHQLIHAEVKNHKCETCGKRFRQPWPLKQHLLVHSTDVPFECEHCKKRFKSREYLKFHLRQHTGERPYSCTECNHDFTSRSNYRKHMRGRHKQM